MKKRKLKKNIVIKTIIIFVLIIIIVLIGLGFNSDEYVYDNVEVVDNLKLHNYNYDLLTVNDKGYYEYFDEINGVNGIIGIDISEHQGEIDWKLVSEAGIEFAIIRVGYRGYESGEINLDQRFHENMENAIANGVKVGVYFFSQAINENEAIDEANFVLEHIKDYELDYPVVFDLEDIYDTKHRIMDLTKQERTMAALAFCGRISYKGYEPMIYLNLNWAKHYYDLEYIANYKTWFAQYDSLPEYEYDYAIWQYSETGIVNGIEELVDLNIEFIK